MCTFEVNGWTEEGGVWGSENGPKPLSHFSSLYFLLKNLFALASLTFKRKGVGQGKRWGARKVRGREIILEYFLSIAPGVRVHVLHTPRLGFGGGKSFPRAPSNINSLSVSQRDKVGLSQS